MTTLSFLSRQSYCQGLVLPIILSSPCVIIYNIFLCHMNNPLSAYKYPPIRVGFKYNLLDHSIERISLKLLSRHNREVK